MEENGKKKWLRETFKEKEKIFKMLRIVLILVVTLGPLNTFELQKC